MSWQVAAVIVIEVLALGYLVYKLRPPRPPRALEKPDVPAAKLVRKKRGSDS